MFLLIFFTENLIRSMLPPYELTSYTLFELAQKCFHLQNGFYFELLDLSLEKIPKLCLSRIRALDFRLIRNYLILQESNFSFEETSITTIRLISFPLKMEIIKLRFNAPVVTLVDILNVFPKIISNFCLFFYFVLQIAQRSDFQSSMV